MVLAVIASGRSGTVVAGRYRLEERIGAGGMGEVYRAQHIELGVDVAIKLLGPAISGLERAVARFRREARAAARLQSAHIVRVFDFGVDGDVPYLTMELLEGENLSQRLSRVTRLSVADAAPLIEQAARGLTAAHSLGIVHRDVKPSNFFLARTADGEVLKVLDFGIAKPVGEDVTVTTSHEVVGSPLYMSPEQVNDEDVDARTDVWSLGVVAFRLITGREAFRAQTTSSALAKICSGSAPRASEVDPGFGAEVDAFFARALATDRRARFQTPGELSAAFSALVDAAGTRASGPEAPDEFFRTGETAVLSSSAPRPQRSRAALWLLAAATLLLILLVIGQRLRSEPSALEPAAASAPLQVDAEVVPPSAAPPVPPLPQTSTPTVTPSAPARPLARQQPVATPRSSASSAPIPSTGEPPAVRKQRDPLFGL